MTQSPFLNRFISALTRLRRAVVRDVPVEMAKCEFDCGKDNCSAADYRTCPGRKAYADTIERARQAEAENAGA